MKELWSDPAWLAGAHAWIDEQTASLGLVRAGEVEQPHLETWSTVLKVPTTTGPVWFKANHGPLEHEAALVTLLTERVPDLVQALLAVDLDRGWMLMSDGGERLRELIEVEQSLERWHHALDAVARISLALEDDVDHLLALGVPDLRLATLPAGYAALMDEIDAEPRFREAAAQVADLSARLAPYGIRDSVQHDDLHDGQIYVRDGRHWVLDWGDACVSHPFFVLSVALEGQLAWGLDDEESSVDTAPFRDTFLAPYAAAYPHLSHADLAEAVRLATRLGWAVRAVNGHIAGDKDQTVTRLTMFVDGGV
ncbi:phosphotransferase [Nocardioides szechwanensis]|uniref:phosphotransferase n=1 Tax=Nocardioides szechwanensis TaxID=1005944 RepID=UPI000B819144|nr:phosphotransferase [Nocardioides szechwanensis]GEP35944.1 phosphotransferase [Nocardioides szechwanensis]